MTKEPQREPSYWHSNPSPAQKGSRLKMKLGWAGNVTRLLLPTPYALRLTPYRYEMSP